MPPISVAKPMGIKIDDAGVLVRNDTLIKIGNSNTTIGVLLTNALSIAPARRVTNSDKCGLNVHRRAKARPTGSNAPVRTSPWPAIISAHTATSASCPKP